MHKIQSRNKSNTKSMVLGSRGNSTGLSNNSGNGSIIMNYASIMSGLRAGSSLTKLKNENNYLSSDTKSESVFKNLRHS